MGKNKASNPSPEDSCVTDLIARIIRYQSKPFTIECQRWDPITAVSLASLSTFSGMVDATAGIFIDPYKEYKHLRSSRNSNPSISAEVPSTTHITTHLDVDVDPNHLPNDPEYARQMALASAISLGKFLGRSSRGMFVDLPLAATEGMLAIPKLYDAQTRVHGPVRGWKSGAVVGWSIFSRGLYEGFTDIFVHTYYGKKKEGTFGVAKGLMKGFTSLTVKTGAATIGLAAYPNQGIYRSLRAHLRTELTRRIVEARWAEAEWIVSDRSGVNVDLTVLCALYDDLLVTRDKAHRARWNFA
jgi:hypothetical protein